MGRFGSVGTELGSDVYTPLDLFRFTSSGVRDLTVGPASPYFSINNGATNLGTYNNPASGGDASDWVRTLAGDSYGSGYSGRTAVVSPTDLVEEFGAGLQVYDCGIGGDAQPWPRVDEPAVSRVIALHRLAASRCEPISSAPAKRERPPRGGLSI